MKRIAGLYEIEARIRGKSAADRLDVRQAESKLLVTELRIWFEARIAKLPARGLTAEAIRYALNHWDGLQRFLDDGRIELDTNSVERAMRPVALSRKNSLFVGSDEGARIGACWSWDARSPSGLREFRWGWGWCDPPADSCNNAARAATSSSPRF